MPQTLGTNPASSSQIIRQTQYLDLSKSIQSPWIVPHVTKILQNFWLTRVITIYTILQDCRSNSNAFLLKDQSVVFFPFSAGISYRFWVRYLHNVKQEEVVKSESLKRGREEIKKNRRKTRWNKYTYREEREEMKTKDKDRLANWISSNNKEKIEWQIGRKSGKHKHIKIL